MNCHGFRDALQEALDTRSELSGPARQHARACVDDGCRVAFEDFRLVVEAARSLPAAESPELVARVMAALAPVTVFRRPAQTLPNRAGSRSTVLSLVTVAGVLIAAFLGLRPRNEADQVVKHHGAGSPKRPVVLADKTSPASVSTPESEPFLPLHLAARAPALVTDTVNGHFDRSRIAGLPVVSPLLSAVTEQFRPMGQELKEWVEQFQSAPDKMMDSTQVESPVRPIS